MYAHYLKLKKIPHQVIAGNAEALPVILAWIAYQAMPKHA